MGTSVKLSLASLSLAVGISACQNASGNDTAAQDELKRDLQLAASSTINLATPKVDLALLTLEGRPQSAPQASSVVRRGAGNRAVRSRTPTVRAEPEIEVAALDDSEVVETVAAAPAIDNAEPVAVAPRPADVFIPTGGTGDYGTAGNGGIFGGGGGGGVVIRGGGVDGDNCELHRRGRIGVPGGVYRIPRTTVPTTVMTPPRSGRSTGIGGFGGARRGGSGSGISSSRVTRPSGVASVSRGSVGRPRGR